MTKYVVTGGGALKGEVKLHGAKNAGFKVMIAALLCDTPSRIENLSYVGDIDNTTEIISCLGGKVSKFGPRSLEIDPAGLNSFDAPKSCGVKSRAGTMFVGPLLARFGRAILPAPGGDKIGARPIDRHLDGLEALGAKVEFKDGVFNVTAPNGLKGCRFRFRKNTHTGTETLIMAAVKAAGQTVLENAAEEPEVDSLIAFLNKAGAGISRKEPRTIVIDGVTKLTGATHQVLSDRNAVVTFACAALATKGDIKVIGADPKTIAAFIVKVKEIGGGVEELPNGLRFFYTGPLKATGVVAAPYPAFMTDWQPIWTTLMTQAAGESEIIETIHNNRFGHVALLTKMGAQIAMFNPEVSDPEKFYNFNIEDDRPENFHGIKVTGPTPLAGAEILINDVRMGSTMILAGLVAAGKTVITDTQDQVARGYEKLAENLIGLGAAIEIARASDVAYKSLWDRY